jgi:hypothetical protein
MGHSLSLPDESPVKGIDALRTLIVPLSSRIQYDLLDDRSPRTSTGNENLAHTNSHFVSNE